MQLSDYLACDATELARLVAAKATSPDELLNLALAQNNKVNGRINAVTRLMEAPARHQISKGPQGPLAGVPFLLKDNQDYAGVPTTHGSRSMQHHIPAHHAGVVQRFMDAGLVIFGKTNLPEFALKAVSDAELFGRANNPWDLTRTPGGSSGGAAAAVAAGVVPMAAANDGGGSIRIPAACCGLFGIKASRGRIPSGPAVNEVWFGASSEGVVSRSVRDSALAMDVLSGPMPGDPYLAPTEPTGYTQKHLQDPGKLRIALCTRSPLGTDVHPQAVAAAHHAADLLRRAGHAVEEASPDIDGAALAQSYLHVYFGQVPATVAHAKALGGQSTEIEFLTRLLVTLGQSVTACDITLQLAQWNTYARSLAKFYESFDLYLTPTLAHPAVQHGAGDVPAGQRHVLSFLQSTGLLGLLGRLGLLDATINQIATDSLRFVPFTQLANLTGTPAMSVPLYWTAEGLPLGVQFMAAMGREDRLFQVAHQLEHLQPWAQRWPDWIGA